MLNAEFLSQVRSFATDHIDLSGCGYGAAHWDTSIVNRPYAYYYFLAGLVAQLPAPRILELGTHFGGSIMSMYRGLKHAGLLHEAEIVTVDIEEHNSEILGAIPEINRVLGDCLEKKTVDFISSRFSGPVDVLFIDSLHTYEHTKMCMQTFVPRMSPRLVILDDIFLNFEMLTLWAELKEVHKGRAFDCTDWAKRGESGMGLIVC